MFQFVKDTNNSCTLFPNEVYLFIKTLENENSNFRSLLKFLGYPENCTLNNAKIFAFYAAV
jgi:hypothetical protein